MTPEILASFRCWAAPLVLTRDYEPLDDIEIEP
jgi:hypothetical protein